MAVGGAGPVERLSRWRDVLAKARAAVSEAVDDAGKKVQRTVFGNSVLKGEVGDLLQNTEGARRTIRIDSKLQYDALMEFGAAYTPGSASKLELYKGERPIFDLFGIEEEIARPQEVQHQPHAHEFVKAEVEVARCAGHAAADSQALAANPGHDDLVAEPAPDLPGSESGPGPERSGARQRVLRERPRK